MKIYSVFAFLLILTFFSCSSNEQSSKSEQPSQESSPTDANSTSEQAESNVWGETDSTASRINPITAQNELDLEALKDPVDLSIDFSQLDLSEIRLLRNAFAARQGYCFMKADLRAIFESTTWYSSRMEDRFWREEEGGDPIPPIRYTQEELEFIDQLKRREEALLKDNLKQEQGRTVPNIENIVNRFQLEKAEPKLMSALSKNGFAIVPNTHEQLFHVYEKNDYEQFPSFVTTDMYMQLFHMYFGFVLRTLEEEKFIPLLSQISASMASDMKDIGEVAADKELQSLANYNATFYAIAYTLLTGKKVEVPASQKQAYQEELDHIQAAEDELSEFLDYQRVEFPYSLFKPRGHYTRSEPLKRYFKAMMWLQVAPFCLDNDIHLKRAILSASVLIESDNFESKSLEKYTSLSEPINFIIGEPDNVSFLDLVKTMKSRGDDLDPLLKQPKKLTAFRAEIKKIADAQNVIRPKYPKSCVDKINFIPQRYVMDNEVLLELVDVDSKITQRGCPNGLDVMAALGSQSARNILLDELKEGEKWSKYPDKLSFLEEKMKNVDWEASIYNKWLYSLTALQKKNPDYPYFMQTPQWEKKDLNTALASWAELKHDAILYAEQPMVAECGSGGPPAPYTVGYVEPNIHYWNAVIELIDLTVNVLDKHRLNTTKITHTSEQLRENASFLLEASEKELAGKTLTEREYAEIERIGSTFEWLTLALLPGEGHYDGWQDVQGPDKSVSVVADVFTANGDNNPDKGIMHVATGYVNDIFVLVEIEGYLYITKGATFQYHEFKLPLGNRLTDEAWQEMLEKNQAPPIPTWIKEIIVPIKAPKSNEKIFYSSGC